MVSSISLAGSSPCATKTFSSGTSVFSCACHGLDVLDPGADHEALTAAPALADQGRAHGRDIEGRDEGPDRQTLAGGVASTLTSCRPTSAD
jgi:hypothetical protein